MVDKADFVASVAVAQAKVPEAYFFACLTMLACFDRVSSVQRQTFARKVVEYQDKVGEWARHSPDNFEHKYLLVEAERARVDGKDWKALEQYEAARDAARRARYLNNETLADECAGRFLLDRGMNRLAAHYFEEARYILRTLDAEAKVAHIENCHAELLGQSQSVTVDGRAALLMFWRIAYSPSATADGPMEVASGVRGSMETTVGLNDLDVPSIVQASQTLAVEINLERLLDKMMAIVLENAGADHAMLMVHEAGRWIVRRQASIDTRTPSLPADTVVDANSAPHSLLNYCAHKRESVLLGSAAGYGSFAGDPYFVATHT